MSKKVAMELRRESGVTPKAMDSFVSGLRSPARVIRPPVLRRRARSLDGDALVAIGKGTPGGSSSSASTKPPPEPVSSKERSFDPSIVAVRRASYCNARRRLSLQPVFEGVERGRQALDAMLKGTWDACKACPVLDAWIGQVKRHLVEDELEAVEEENGSSDDDEQPSCEIAVVEEEAVETLTYLFTDLEALGESNEDLQEKVKAIVGSLKEVEASFLQTLRLARLQLDGFDEVKDRISTSLSDTHRTLERFEEHITSTQEFLRDMAPRYGERMKGASIDSRKLPDRTANVEASEFNDVSNVKLNTSMTSMRSTTSKRSKTSTSSRRSRSTVSVRVKPELAEKPTLDWLERDICTRPIDILHKICHNCVPLLMELGRPIPEFMPILERMKESASSATAGEKIADYSEDEDEALASTILHHCYAHSSHEERKTDGALATTILHHCYEDYSHRGRGRGTKNRRRTDEHLATTILNHCYEDLSYEERRADEDLAATILHHCYEDYSHRGRRRRTKNGRRTDEHLATTILHHCDEDLSYEERRADEDLAATIIHHCYEDYSRRGRRPSTAPCEDSRALARWVGQVVYSGACVILDERRVDHRLASEDFFNDELYKSRKSSFQSKCVNDDVAPASDASLLDHKSSEQSPIAIDDRPRGRRWIDDDSKSFDTVEQTDEPVNSQSVPDSNEAIAGEAIASDENAFKNRDDTDHNLFIGKPAEISEAPRRKTKRQSTKKRAMPLSFENEGSKVQLAAVLDEALSVDGHTVNGMHQAPALDEQLEDDKKPEKPMKKKSERKIGHSSTHSLPTCDGETFSDTGKASFLANTQSSGTLESDLLSSRVDLRIEAVSCNGNRSHKDVLAMSFEGTHHSLSSTCASLDNSFPSSSLTDTITRKTTHGCAPVNCRHPSKKLTDSIPRTQLNGSSSLPALVSADASGNNWNTLNSLESLSSSATFDFPNDKRILSGRLSGRRERGLPAMVSKTQSASWKKGRVEVPSLHVQGSWNGSLPQLPRVHASPRDAAVLGTIEAVHLERQRQEALLSKPSLAVIRPPVLKLPKKPWQAQAQRKPTRPFDGEAILKVGHISRSMPTLREDEWRKHQSSRTLAKANSKTNLHATRTLVTIDPMRRRVISGRPRVNLPFISEPRALEALQGHRVQALS